MSQLPNVTENVALDGTTATSLSIQGASGAPFPLVHVASETARFVDLSLANGGVQVASGATVSFELSTDRTLAEVVSQPGALEKLGSAKLILTGANSYSGGTTISAGTLQGNTTSLQGNIANNAALVFDQAANGTYTGIISGTGQVAKQGAGELTFTGANTYTGGTTISAGALRGDPDVIPGNVSIASGAKLGLTVDLHGIKTQAGNLTGAGSLEKAGDGTLILTGVNGFAAATVEAGDLQGNAASLPGNIQIDAVAALVFDQTGDGTRSGALSGGGSLTKLGAGALTLVGASSYTGGTTVSEGTLIGDTGSLRGAIANAAALVFDQPSDGTFADVISGSGTLQKVGSGTLTLARSQTYTGLTTVSGGRLDLPAAVVLPAALQVDAAGVLSGAGTIGGALTVDGTVAPGGSSIGSLSAATATTFHPGSILEVDLTETGSSDVLAVSGAATIDAGASVFVRPAPGGYLAPVSVDVLTAGPGGVMGVFVVTPDLAFLDVTSITLADRVSLDVVFNGAALASFAQTPNQQAVAGALQAAEPTATGDLATVFANLTPLTVEEIPPVLDSMSGEPLTQFTTTRLALGTRLDRLIHTRLYDLEPVLEATQVGQASEARRGTPAPMRPGAVLPAVSLPPAGASGFGAWLDGFGVFGAIDGQGGVGDLDYQIGGGAFGLDYRPTPHAAVGGAFAYGYTDLDFPDSPASGHANSTLGALYGAYGTSRLHLGASGRFGYHEMESARGIAFSSIDRSARADFDGQDYGARVEGAFELLPASPVHVQPVAGFSYVHLVRDDFTERGADSLDLEVDDETIDSLVSEAGARVYARFEMEQGWWFTPELWGRWLHEFGDTDRRIDVRLSGATTGGAFTVAGADLPRDTAAFGVRWTSSREGAGAVISWDGLWNSQLLENSIRLGFQFVW